MFSSASRICRFMYLPSLGSCQSFELFPLPLLLWGQNDTNSRLRHPAAGWLSSPCLGLFFSPLLGHGLFPPSLCSNIEPIPSTGPVVSVEFFGSEIPILSFLPMYVSCRLRPGFPLFRSRRRARNRWRQEPWLALGSKLGGLCSNVIPWGLSFCLIHFCTPYIA